MTSMGVLARGILVLGVSGNCTAACHAREPAKDTMANTDPTRDPIPAHLKHFPGLSVRSGDTIVPAPDADVSVAQSYPTAPSRGAWFEGRRITILTRDTTAKLGQAVRIVHVVESIRAGDSLYVMGPKAVLGEHVDGKLATAAAPDAGDPLVPSGDYDGPVLPAPAVDYNYDITHYQLPVGRHIVAWRLGALHSNQLTIEVTP
jgi:hypothetical protein